MARMAKAARTTIPTQTSNGLSAACGKTLWLVFAVLLNGGCARADTRTNHNNGLTRGFELIAEYPHRPTAFTQGLLILDTKHHSIDDRANDDLVVNEKPAVHDSLILIEGTGQKGQSSISTLKLGESINVLQTAKLADTLFGEGVAQYGNKLFQLTWQAGQCIVYDTTTLTAIETKHYEGQGWGLTANTQHLIMSDGSARLQFRDPDNFNIVKTLVVNDRGRPVKALNELEWVNGLIYANIWYSNWIVAIDDKTGRIQYKVDLSELHRQQPANADVLNGIAYNTATDTFLVTGKYWTKIYEIRLADNTTQR